MVSLRRIMLPVLLGMFSGFGLACFDSCEPPFPPGNHVDKFRILAIQAEPPEIAPGERTTVTFLAIDPKGLVKGSQAFPPSQCFTSNGLPDPSAVWVACLPGLGLDKQSAQSCSDFSFLQRGGGDAGAPGPLPDAGGRSIQILFPPCGSRSLWVSPKDYLDSLPKEKQKEGGDAIFVLATLQNKRQQISLKKVRVSSKTKEERNHNPKLTGFMLNSLPVASCRPENKEDCQIHTHPVNQKLNIRVMYDKTLQDKLIVKKGQKPRKEDWTIEWFATDGEFSTRRTVISGETPPRDSPFPTWQATNYKGETLPIKREIQLIALVRDGRGGVDWLSVRIVLGPAAK